MTEATPSGLLRWLWKGYLAPHSRLLAVALVLMAVEGASLGLFAAMVQPMFDSIFVDGRSEALWTVGVAVLAIFLARALTSFGHRVLLTRISEVTAAQLRGDLLAHLMRLDGRFHQDNPPGQLIERVQGDVSAINKIWSGVITGIGRDLVSVVALFAVALAVDWRWTLLALLGIPILVTPALLAQRYVRARARQAREVAARMSTRLDEVFHGLETVKLNALERYQSDRYALLVRDRIRTETRSSIGQAAIPSLIDIMTGLGFLAVLFYGGAEIIAGNKTVGQFMSFFAAMSLAFEPLRRLGNISGLWQSAAASIERIRAIFAIEPTITSPARPAPLPTGTPDVVFEDVHLSYGAAPVLNGVSFRAEPGRTTALVGASGAGKSTIFKALARLVDADSGRITIGGTPVTDLALPDLRGLFSVVTQEAVLFDETLRENILLGRTDIPEDRLMEVVEAAHIAEFLPKLPAGLDSPAGPRGSALSGGQRQRIAIARALLRDTPILLLDEATSALDLRSEALVQEAIARLSTGRTVLVIAHRLSTIREADHILVMDRGRVAARGTHDELIAGGGLYAELERMQFRDAG